MQKQQALFSAIREEDLGALLTVLRNEEFTADELNAEFEGEVAIPLAANAVDRGMAKAMCAVLLKHGAFVSQAQERMTALYFACSNGDLALCKLLVSHGARLFVPGEMLSLVKAVTNVECLCFLLDDALKQLPVDLNRQHVLTVALQCAVFTASEGAVRILLEMYGANPNVEAGPFGDEFGLGTYPAAVYLVECKTTDAPVLERITHLMVRHGLDLTLRVEDTVLLNKAVVREQTAVVKALLECGANPNDVADDLCNAVARVTFFGSPELLELFLAKGANPHSYDPTKHAFSPLDAAIMRGRSCLLSLLKRGADPNAPSGTSLLGMRPLHFAASLGDTESIRSLLQFGAAVDLKDSRQRSALGVSAMEFQFRATALLLEFGADPREACARATSSLRVDDWLEAEFGPEFRNDAVPGQQTVLSVISENLSRGLVWPSWSKQKHKFFPRVVRRAIHETLLCAKRSDCLLSKLTHDLLFLLFEYVATSSSKDGAWLRCGMKPTNEDFSETFLDMIVLHNAHPVMEAATMECLRNKTCTKKVFGSEYVMQPLYVCRTCSFFDPTSYSAYNVSSSVSLCQACIETCHKGHNVSLLGFSPLFCDCADTHVCQHLPQLQYMLANPSLLKLGAKEFFIVAVEDFLPSADGSVLPVPAGAVLRVKRSDFENGNFIGDWHGVSTRFSPPSTIWIGNCVVMLRDNDRSSALLNGGDGSNEDDRNAYDEEYRDLPFKKGQIVIVQGLVHGKRASSNDAGDRLRGRICESGFRVGSFCALDAENFDTYDEVQVTQKLQMVDAYRQFLRCSQDRSGARWGEALEHAVKFASFEELFNKSKGFGMSPKTLLPMMFRVLRFAETASKLDLQATLLREMKHQLRNSRPDSPWVIFVNEQLADLAFSNQRHDFLKMHVIELEKSGNTQAVIYGQILVALLENNRPACARLHERVMTTVKDGDNDRALQMYYLAVAAHAVSSPATFTTAEYHDVAAAILARHLASLASSDSDDERMRAGIRWMLLLHRFHAGWLCKTALPNVSVAEKTREIKLVATDLAVFALTPRVLPWLQFEPVQIFVQRTFGDLCVAFFRIGEFKNCAMVARLAWGVMASSKNGEKLCSRLLSSDGPLVTLQFFSVPDLEEGRCFVAFEGNGKTAEIPNGRSGPFVAVGKNQAGEAVYFSTTVGVSVQHIESLRGGDLASKSHSANRVFLEIAQRIEDNARKLEEITARTAEQKERERKALMKEAHGEDENDNNPMMMTNSSTGLKIAVGAIVVGVAVVGIAWFFTGKKE